MSHIVVITHIALAILMKLSLPLYLIKCGRHLGFAFSKKRLIAPCTRYFITHVVHVSMKGQPLSLPFREKGWAYTMKSIEKHHEKHWYHTRAYLILALLIFSEAHGTSWVTCVWSNNKHITDEIFASVTKEVSLILATRFLGNRWWNLRKKNLLTVHFWKTEEKEEKINTAGNCKAFCVRRKRKKRLKKTTKKISVCHVLLLSFLLDRLEISVKVT